MKEIVIIAGPNGSGKTTLAGQLNLPFSLINADMYEKTLNHIANKSEREQYAVIMFAKEINAQIKQGNSFAFETVFSSDDIPNFLLKAKSKGYIIKLHYISTDNHNINISRVAKRVSEGGHDVPTDKLIIRYKSSLELLPKLLLFADSVLLYDNSKNSITPFLIKECNQIKIIDDIPCWAKLLNLNNCKIITL